MDTLSINTMCCFTPSLSALFGGGDRLCSRLVRCPFQLFCSTPPPSLSFVFPTSPFLRN
ncbi:hypothetical protein CGRA01v4_06349 [Colletotrichum graminicola]|nr:hypothetical protein CGRA01v4_06349 [Colletotrichum graminicola]